MVRTFLRYALSFSLFLMAPSVWASEQIESNAVQSSASNSYGDSSGSAGMANTAMISQLMGAGSNAAAGAMYRSICSTRSGGWACPMATMSYVQAGLMLASAFMSGNTRNAATNGIPSIPTVDIPGFGENPGLGTTARDLDAAISEGLKDMSAKGYSLDPKTGIMNTPDGPIQIDENTTPASLAGAMGGSASDMKLAESTAIQLNEKLAKQFDPSQIKASVSGVEVDGGGGGGGGSYSGSKAPNLADYFKQMRGPASNPGALVAGKSRMLGADSIGIKVDNLFEMVHRRYQDKRKARTFIEKP